MSVSVVAPQNKINTAKPSFCGLTHVFKKKLIHNGDAYDQLVKASNVNYLGSLPPEIIKKVIEVAKDTKEKTKIIKDLLAGFSKASMFLKRIELSSQQYLAGEVVDKKLKKDMIKRASKTLSNAFSNAKIIGKKEKVELKAFKDNDGSFGIVYNLIFPKSLNCPMKALKVFKEKNNVSSIQKMLGIHGVVPEANAAMYISKQQSQPFKKSVFVKPYVVSIKDGFMINEHLANYPKVDTDWYKIKRYWHNNNITCDDVIPNFECNISNNRIYDFGGVKLLNKQLNHNSNKIYKKLDKADRKELFSEDKKELLNLVKKYTSGKTKDNPLDVKIALEHFTKAVPVSDEIKAELAKYNGL